MASYDFSAPFVAARIVLPNGDAFPLWTNVGGEETGRPTIPGQEDLQALAFVQEVQVKLDLSGMPQISVQLAPPFEDGMKFLDSALADGRRQNRLEVQLGYAGGTGDAGPLLSPPFVATISAPEVSIDVDVQITLKGVGLGQSAQIETGRVVGRENEKRWDIIRRLAAGDGSRRTLEVDFSEVEADPTSEQYRRCDAPASDYSQGGRTDWLALWELAEATQCVMNVAGPTDDGSASRLVWIPRRQREFSGPPVRRYRLYHYPGGQLRGEARVTGESDMAELPLLSFSCNTEAIWNAMTYADVGNDGFVQADVNEEDVAAQEETVTVEGESAPADVEEGALTVESGGELSGTPNVLPGAPDNPDAVRRASTEISTSGGMATQCEIETLGDPALTPGDVVLLAGLGRRFDDRTYHVFELTHSIGLGGFSTNVTIHAHGDPISAGRRITGPRSSRDLQQQVEGFEARPPDPVPLRRP